MNEIENRRSFIRKMATIGVGISGVAASTKANEVQSQSKSKANKKPDGKLRFGFIGVGGRCQEHIGNVLAIEGNEVVAICDISQLSIDTTLKNMERFNVAVPKIYTGSEKAFEQMLANENFDAVIIASPWEWHVRMSIAAMKAGVPYVGVEVSAANTLEECWDLVNVAEATGSQLNILENVCYRRDVMACLKMVREGLFGELLHARCGYEHDLREVKFNDGVNFVYQNDGNLKMGKDAFAEASWRTQHSIARNGDLYPTHGVGPVANCMNINRGNRFISLSAMATKSRGLHKYIVDNGGENHPYAKVNFNCGDIVTSMIQCANGETIIITHDTNSPRPYSLGFRIQGTEGLWYNDGDSLYIQGKSEPHKWDTSAEWFKKYDHGLWNKLETDASHAGHGGMDFVMMYDFVNAIRNKRPAPMDCYDAAAWSAISALSEMSVARGGALVDFPDFTRGQWIIRTPQFGI